MTTKLDFMLTKCIHNTYLAIVHLQCADSGSKPQYTDTVESLRTKLQHMWTTAIGANMNLTFHHNPERDSEIWLQIADCASAEKSVTQQVDID